MKHSSKKTFLIILSTLLFSNIYITYAQENWKDGYIITNSGDSIRGSVDYQNWDKTPRIIRFRQNNQVFNYKPIGIKGFYVENELYISQIMPIDIVSRSKPRPQRPNEPKNAIDSVFLLQVVKGRLSLYALKDQNAESHFFVQKENNPITELTYKVFLFEKEGNAPRVVKDNSYRFQLVEYLKDCEGISKQVDNTDYTTNSLKKLILSYNQTCFSTELKYVKSQEKDIWKFGILAGASTTFVSFFDNSTRIFSVSTNAFIANLKPPAYISPIFGVSLEVIFPRNFRRASIYNELLYQKYAMKESYQGSVYTQTLSLGLAYLKIVNMFRYRLNKEGVVRPFASAGLSNGMLIQESAFVDYDRILPREDRKSDILNFQSSILLGLGVASNKVNAELRYSFDRSILDSSDIGSRVSSIWFLVGYKF